MNKQALIDLRDKVKAGKDEHDMFCPMWHEVGLCTYAECAMNGSLDSALYLHEALLPGWDIQIVTYEDDTFEASVARPLKCKTFDGVATSMARAWLIAILEALIAEAE